MSENDTAPPPPAAHPAPRPRRRPTYAFLGLAALGFLLTLELLRTVLPLLAFVPRARLGWPVGATGGLALALFATAFLATPLGRALGGRHLLLAAGLALVVPRLVLQLWRGDALVDLGLASVALVATALFPPALLARLRTANLSPVLFAVGVWLGATLDVARLALLGTWDLLWRDDVGSLVATVALAAAFLGLLWRVVGSDAEKRMAPRNRVWPWLAFGPLVFLQLLLFANPGRLAAATGWSLEACVATLLAVQLAALATTTHGPRVPGRGLFVLAATGLVAAIWSQPEGGWAAARLVVAAPLCALLFARALDALATPVDGARPSHDRPHGLDIHSLDRLGLVHGLGWLLLGALLFVETSAFVVRLPIDPARLPAVAGAVLALAALVTRGTTFVSTATTREYSPRWPLPVAATLLLVPLAMVALRPSPPVSPPAGGDATLRIMTYNLHGGVNVEGRLDLEAIARTIEAGAPDVVALQETSRGWLVNGGVDMVGWLGRRLAMPHALFAGHAGAGGTWGNAILSRRPLVAHEIAALPPATLAIPRGLIAARIELDGAPLTVVVTHFHNGRGAADGAVRRRQAAALLEHVDPDRRTVVAGDFNATPGTAAFHLLLGSGLVDAYSEAGIGPGATFPSTAPERRIDYLWLSRDLRARDVRVLPSLASDHFPLVAEIRPQRSRQDAGAPSENRYKSR